MEPRRHSTRATVAGLALLVVVGGCGDDGPAPPGSWSPAPVTTPALADPVLADDEIAATGVVVPVIALDNSFRPQSLEINVGDTVEWENRGENEHNVLSIEGDDWGVEVTDFQPGDVYAHVFAEPGEYAYFCSIHGNQEVGMVGTITVVP
jgi:plastocyanin